MGSSPYKDLHPSCEQCDASVHPNVTGTCAWTIWANLEVWSGKGYVPGPVTDMYSRLAEAYGIYTVMSFFSQYLLLHPLTFTQPCNVHVYCDNSGVIERIQTTSLCPYPRDAICNDYPIFAEIQNLLCDMPTMQSMFHHVKGPQKETVDHRLTQPECLNINCDACSAQLPPPSMDLPLRNNPILDAGYPHLIINDQCIIQHLQHCLHDVATK